MAGVDERQPLLSGSSPNAAHGPSALSSTRPGADYNTLSNASEENGAITEEEQARIEEQIAQESAFAAIQDAAHGVDPNSSAFAPLGNTSHFSLNASAIHASAINGSGLGPGPAEEAAAAAASSTPTNSADVWIVLPAMWIGTFLAALDGTIVATVLSTVGSEFKVSKEIGWLGTSYLLTQTGFQPLYGKCSDIFGRKPATLFASAIFLIGSLLCGLSRTFTELCIARAIAGIGGGGLTTMSTIVTSDLVTLQQRGTFQGLGNLVFATGAAIGGPLGGALTDSGIGWRWAFLVQVPLCLVHFGVVSWKINIPAGPGSMIEKIKRIDALGAITLVSSVTLILVALSVGGNERPWSDALVLGTLFGGLGGAVVFVLVEKYIAREPLMPLSVVFTRTPGFVALTALFISMSQFGILFNIPLYFTAVEETSSKYAGLHLIPNSVLASACSLGSGLIMARTGKYKNMLLLVAALGWTGPLMMMFWQKPTPEWLAWLAMPWNGVAYGGILTITLVGLIASIAPQNVSAATGAIYLFRAVGSITGVSLTQALLQARLQSTLKQAGLPRKMIAAIREDVSFIKTLPRGLRDAAIQAYSKSLHAVFIGIFVTAFLAFVCAFGIQEFELPGAPKPAQPPVRTREQTIAEEEEEEAL